MDLVILPKEYLAYILPTQYTRKSVSYTKNIEIRLNFWLRKKSDSYNNNMCKPENLVCVGRMTLVQKLLSFLGICK